MNFKVGDFVWVLASSGGYRARIEGVTDTHYTIAWVDRHRRAGITGLTTEVYRKRVTKNKVRQHVPSCPVCGRVTPIENNVLADHNDPSGELCYGSSVPL